MRARRWMAASLCAAVCTGAIGCGDGPNPAGPGETFRVSGTIQNNTAYPVPGSARLLVAWVVSSGSPDYSYVFGEGTIDAGAGTFEIDLEQPPAQALNAGAFGVGILVVTTNPSLTTGSDLDSAPLSDFIGAAGDYAVIYIADQAAAAAALDWTADFDGGYGVGVGQEVTGSFDVFVPTSADGVILTIDDIDNIEFVNWS